jgi:dipeptidyl aminopeptidase/acylaminoacyl peptidase
MTSVLIALGTAPGLAEVGTEPGVAELAAQQRPMTVVDLINVPAVRDPQLSPLGDQVLFVRGDANWDRDRVVSHVWRWDMGAGSGVRLTNGEDGESAPRWSPDGRTVAFLARRGEEEATQIHLLASGGGEAAALTRHPTSVTQYQWSPDGRWIYFLAEDPVPDIEQARRDAGHTVYAFDEDFQHRHIWRVDAGAAAGGAVDAERLTGGDFSYTSFRLSRDGTRIAAHRGDTPLLGDLGRWEVWVMNADGSDPLQLTDNDIPESGAQLSPDNQWVVFTADAFLIEDDFDFYYNDNIFLVPADGSGEVEILTPTFDGQVSSVEWAADGASVFFTANVGVRSEIYQVELDSGAILRLTRGDHQLSSWSYSPMTGRHVFTRQTSESPGDIHTMEAGGGELSKVTSIFDHLAEEFLLPRQEAITWEGDDGVEVEGLLFYPLDYNPGQRYPLMVQTHGGPASSDRFQFGGSSDYIQVLTAKGYFVLLPNYRGSTGYGDEFLRNMVGNYFDQAHLDVMTGVDHLLSEGLVVPDRMAKMGWSAGGHMTNKLITFTDRFQAASSGAGAANWVSMYAQSDVRVYRTPWFGGTPWEEDAPIDQYWEDSPLREISRVTTPTLFLVGENDARVPMPQSVEMYRGLKHNGVPTHLYVAPGEGHGWRALRHRLFKANVELDWWERWVTGGEYVWEIPPGEDPPPVSE